VTLFDAGTMHSLEGPAYTVVTAVAVYMTYLEHSRLRFVYAAVSAVAAHGVYLPACEQFGKSVNPVERLGSQVLLPLVVSAAWVLSSWRRSVLTVPTPAAGESKSAGPVAHGAS